jgi:hypothetical protein
MFPLAEFLEELLLTETEMQLAYSMAILREAQSPATAAQICSSQTSITSNLNLGSPTQVMVAAVWVGQALAYNSNLKDLSQRSKIHSRYQVYRSTGILDIRYYKNPPRALLSRILPLPDVTWLLFAPFDGHPSCEAHLTTQKGAKK